MFSQIIVSQCQIQVGGQGGQLPHKAASKFNFYFNFLMNSVDLMHRFMKPPLDINASNSRASRGYASEPPPGLCSWILWPMFGATLDVIVLAVVLCTFIVFTCDICNELSFYFSKYHSEHISCL